MPSTVPLQYTTTDLSLQSPQLTIEPVLPATESQERPICDTIVVEPLPPTVNTTIQETPQLLYEEIGAMCDQELIFLSDSNQRYSDDT